MTNESFNATLYYSKLLIIVTHVLHQFLRARRPYEAVDVDVDESGHQELAVEPVHDAAVPGNDVAKILNKRYVIKIQNRYISATFRAPKSYS